MARKRVAILISGRGSNMAALIAAAQDKSYPAEIVLVVSNIADAGGLQIARDNRIETQTIEHKAFGKDRDAFDRALNDALVAKGIEIVCLAGFMRLLTPWFVGQWQGRLLNVHPALLPSFKGLDTHERAIDTGVKIHGATVHFVVPEVDSGPIVAQAALAVRSDDTPESLASRVIKLEHRIYPMALKLVAEGRVRIEGGRCIVDAPSADDAALVVPKG